MRWLVGEERPNPTILELSRQCCRSNFQGYTHPRHCTHEPISRSAQRIKRLWCGHFDGVLKRDEKVRNFRGCGIPDGTV